MLALVSLVGLLGLGALTAWDATHMESRTGRVVSVDDGWCGFDWDGDPRPSRTLAMDACPADTQVGDELPIQVTPEGAAWTSVESFWTTMGGLLLLASTATVGLFGGWVFMRWWVRH